jgi:hypothetical protein
MRYQDIPLYEPPVRYKIRTPETWAKVREDYAAGMPASEVAEKHDVGLSCLRQRARVEGWRRRDLDDPDPEPIDANAHQVLPGELAKQAWARAARAVERGRVLEAQRWSRLAAGFREAARELAELAHLQPLIKEQEQDGDESACEEEAPADHAAEGQGA